MIAPATKGPTENMNNNTPMLIIHTAMGMSSIRMPGARLFMVVVKKLIPPTKKAMISELMGEITPEMLIQEINRYADSEFRYAGSSDEAAVNAMVREMRLRESASRRYAEERGGGESEDGEPS